MATNISFFEGEARKWAYLKARGFNPKTGARSGGIKNPLQVTVPPGTVLLRTYQDQAWLFGEWWFTANEMAQIVAYFGRKGSEFAVGRSEGKGILQATMAVRHEWGKFSINHMGLAAAIRTTGPLQAFFGESDEAPDSTQKNNLKPVEITDSKGQRRPARQVFLPDTELYKTSLTVIERNVSSDTDLIRLVQAYDSGPLSFET